MRPSIYKTYSEVVLALSKRSTCSARARVGALLYDEQYRIIATGYNGVPFGFDHCDDVGCDRDSDGHCKNAIHAEENALLQCAVIGRSTKGLRLFTTHSPCWKCSLRLIQAGIVEVIYMNAYGDAIDKVIRILHDHNVSVNQFIGTTRDLFITKE